MRPNRTLLPVLIVAASLVALVPARAQVERCDCDDPFGSRQHRHFDRAPAVPSAVGQDIVAALQQVTALLLADPSTDWSQVRIGALHEHLVDLHEVMLSAQVEQTDTGGGFDAVVRGQGRTRAAIDRAVVAHAQTLDDFRGWSIRAEPTAEGVRFEVRADSEDEVAVARGLGFFGLMASGVHYPHRLLAIARGKEVP